MPIQKVYLKNNLTVKQNQQSNVAITSVAPNSTGDTVEISNKKKENKALKYVLIGAGTLAGIIAFIKHKSITKIFKKASEVVPNIKPTMKEAPKSTEPASNFPVSKNINSQSRPNIQTPSAKIETSSVSSIHKNKAKNSISAVEVKNKVDIVQQNAPSPLVPLERITDIKGEPFIENCTEGYQLWHFVSPEFLKKFISSHQDLSELFEKTGLGKYGLYNLKFIKEDAQIGKAEVISFVKAVKEKTGVDLCGEFKHYRFIGQSELDVIKTGKDIEQGKYLTLSPNGGGRYNIVPNKTDYRITFKNTDNLVNHLAPYHDTAYKTWTKTPYLYKDVEKVEKLVDGKWQEVEFLPQNTTHKSITKAIETSVTTADVKPKIVSQEIENFSKSISPVKKLSEDEVKSFIGWHPHFKYKLSDSEINIIKDKYGEYSENYIETLGLEIDEKDIPFMTKLVNICNSKYAEYWKSNPDKLILINNAKSLHNKIDRNLSEHDWDIIINSFKTLFDKKIDTKTIDAIIKYKGIVFDRINGTIIQQNYLDQILKNLDKKEKLNIEEIQQIKFKLKYLQDILSDQLYINNLNKDSHKFVFKSFNKLLNYLNNKKLDSKKINKFKNELLNYKTLVTTAWMELNIQDKIKSITEIIKNNGVVLDGIKLNRTERNLKGSILSTIEVDGQPLSEIMIKAKTDEKTRSKISTYLNTNQPVIDKDSFMSTSLPLLYAFNNNEIYWKLIPQKGVKGIYIEDAFDILYQRQNGCESEVLIQRGSKIQIKKAEYKDGAWHLEGIVSPSEI